MLDSTPCATALLVALALAITAGAQVPTLEQRIDRLEREAGGNDPGAGTADASHKGRLLDEPAVGSSTELLFWGRANFLGIYDNYQGAGGVGGGDFHTYVTQEGNEELSFIPRDTRLGCSATGRWDDWTAKAVCEIEFYGGNAGDNFLPRLRLGYAEIADAHGFSLRTGQDWIPIAQQHPGSLDLGIMCFNGNLWNRVPQITARWKDGGCEYLLGLLHLRIADAQDQQERMPWVVGRVACTVLDGRGLLALGAGYRSNHIENAGGAAAGVTNHLLAAEAKLPITDTIDVTAEIWTGAGIGREFLRTGFDYNSLGDEINSSGGFVSMHWQPANDWNFHFGLAIDQPADDDTDGTSFFGSATPFDSNHAVFANVQYTFDKHTSVGFEYTDYETEELDGGTYGASGQVLRGQRAMVGVWFVF